MIFSILLTVTTLAQKPREPSCTELKIAAQSYSEAEIIAHARRQGFTQADIERIRKRCLPRS